MARTILIGDIHGCYSELQALLDLVAPAADDRIIALGDIVDRGPDSEKVLAFFRDTPNATSLLGNHERKHIRSARGQTRAALSQMIVRGQLAERYPAWLSFLETLPRHIELPEAILVHGFFEPGVPLEDQQDVVVVGTLTGEAHIQEKLPSPWYDHYAGPKPLVVGHHSYLGTGEPVIREGLFYGIDTGCAHGGRLTALVLPEFRIVSVPSRTDYWTTAKRSFMATAMRKRSCLDVDFATLRDCLKSVVPDDEATNDDADQPLARLAGACGRLADAVCQAAASRVSDLLRELAEAPDWEALREKKRIGRFARRVQKDPAAPVLFGARKGGLDRETLYGIAKTPRGLQMLAENLGLTAELPEPARRDPEGDSS